MQPTGLAQYYDMIKNGENPNIINSDSSAFVPMMHHKHHHMGHDDFEWKRKVMDNCNDIKDRCGKHILLDIYVHILPLDNDYKCRNMKMMKNDIDTMLKNKNMTSNQYLTSCYEKTKAPLLNFIIRNIEEIGRRYLEDASQTLTDNKAPNGQVQQTPEIKSPDDKEVETQLIDVKKNTEYSSFVDELKKKTVNKIVKDVSDLINNKQEEKNMEFHSPVDNNSTPTNESSLIVCMDCLQKYLWESQDLIENNQEELLGIAIREATLNQLDIVFKQSGWYVKDFYNKLWKNKGVLINEHVKELFN